jgi:hypothetical protein
MCCRISHGKCRYCANVNIYCLYVSKITTFVMIRHFPLCKSKVCLHDFLNPYLHAERLEVRNLLQDSQCFVFVFHGTRKCIIFRI